MKLIEVQGGSVINISSIVGPMPTQPASVYNATKAVDAITVTLSQELGPPAASANNGEGTLTQLNSRAKAGSAIL